MAIAENILDEALRITSGDRMEKYGDPRDNFKGISKLWNAYLRVKIGDALPGPQLLNEKDVALMMTMLKIAREANAHDRDNLVDAAGYLRTASIIEGLEDD